MLRLAYIDKNRSFKLKIALKNIFWYAPDPAQTTAYIHICNHKDASISTMNIYVITNLPKKAMPSIIYMRKTVLDITKR